MQWLIQANDCIGCPAFTAPATGFSTCTIQPCSLSHFACIITWWLEGHLRALWDVLLTPSSTFGPEPEAMAALLKCAVCLLPASTRFHTRRSPPSIHHLRLIQPVTHLCQFSITAELHPARQEDRSCARTSTRGLTLRAKHHAHIISLIHVDEEAPFDPICLCRHAQRSICPSKGIHSSPASSAPLPPVSRSPSSAEVDQASSGA
jgi:hypothetical protein